jgi:CheY-like chemotaxis protein
VRGDPHQFEQVVVNLAANARDAMPGGGTLRIGTEVREPDADRVARLRLPGLGAYVVVSVSDSGEGMDERTQRQIFDPFYTTKDPGKGTGLGLSIVYSVVEQATGAIEVESVRGEGTRFLLWLPAVPAPGREQAAPPDPAAMRGDERVLFVEDEPAVRRLGMRILEQAGYRVFEAHDGQEAITLMEQQTTPVDVVVSDVIMPNMGGAELARRLRATRPDLPILFVSGHPEDRAGAVAIDGAELLRKPFTAEALLQRLRELLDRHQG